MSSLFSNRILNTKKSFIREILKVTSNKEIISFAGGLPNPISFPIEALEASIHRIIQTQGTSIFQYATTEGYLPLREYIAKRYTKRFGLDIKPEHLLITSGSQQALDLLGKILINEGDEVLLEKPSYLGAIQSLCMSEPTFLEVNLTPSGPDLKALEEIFTHHAPKLFYTVPNFQNPTGLTYSLETRKALGKLLHDKDTVLIEDDPYGELRFMGEDLPYSGFFGAKRSVLLGSFSKIVTPGMRIGWICTQDEEIMDKLITAKQAADLHTNYFSQVAIHDYLIHNDLDAHIQTIKALYLKQRNTMLDSIKEYFPANVEVTEAEGGMFLWVTLPAYMSALELFDLASKANVAFVPGEPFYANDMQPNTLRINYTNSDPATIREGIKRLATAIYTLETKHTL
ncbi:aspartate aminotransferase [Sporanaerobium hydrogeniformans]|uniref:Aspartate aminotransferase n=1 Tax=Sporanaerobium hydrogeniformans TaxID=3072179 RepID=A0AC61DH14_9FIRM|nr:PLP-dependent aminotransferase family protein [Sporanaerobium hydrogeniformans]PHV72273.1 aspartate aminotransferase [Sporanaerobium hydrogeniformans]